MTLFVAEAIMASAVSVRGAVAQTKPHSVTYLDPGHISAPARPFFIALGDRLWKPGKERVTLSGTYTDQNGTGQGRYIWQLPGLARFDRANQPNTPVIVDDQTGLVNASSISQSDADIMESLSDDCAESFFYGFSKRAALRFLGGRFRADDGSTPNYQGPWYDIYESFEPSKAQPGGAVRRKLYYFDSTTGLLTKVQYETASTPKVSTEFSNWQVQAGQAVPGKIVRQENGKPVFTFTVAAASVGPSAADGLFPSN
jgi:hypothetical protein